MIKSIEYTIPIEHIEPIDIKPLCKYLLPCGICDLTKKQCNTDFIKEMTINGCNKE